MATKKETTEKKAKKSTAATPAPIIVLRKARVTEKAARASADNIYTFDVQHDATKREIAKAFEAQYKKKPLKVNTTPVPRKSYFRRGTLGFGKFVKKAYIRLPKGTTIDIA